MPSAFRRNRGQSYELLPRASIESDPEQNEFIAAFPHKLQNTRPSWFAPWASRIVYTLFCVLGFLVSPFGVKRKLSRTLYCVLFGTPYFFTALVLLTAVFRPSYTHPPPHYTELRRRCTGSQEPGRGNPHNEKVFIAASIYDHEGELLGGLWGKAMLELVDILGPQNVYLSIYENDADPNALDALSKFKEMVKFDHTILNEHLPLEDISRVTLPSGESRIKRIAFLAEVRNRALRPLESITTRYDKLLYVNDVVFDPVDAVQLLMSTGQNPGTGRTTYAAACAVDFINAFKFYDRFATRDLEGYSMGIPFYPWFATAGNSVSRKDVLAQSDAVRVRACWGGMTAFEARFFQNDVPAIDPTSPPTSSLESSIEALPNAADAQAVATIPRPVRFRYETDPYWDASECCLIHADVTFAAQGRNATHNSAGDLSSGIVMNPYIRVAYDSTTLSWLGFTRRFERLYSVVHDVANRWVGFPYPNPRRLEQPGDKSKEWVWMYDDGEKGEMGKGEFKEVTRMTEPGRFCGGRKLLVINENPGEGEKNWEDIPIPGREGA
ncbi:hypothetical protein EJ05DRAFT_482324 [Pseudovirgaria hyperparasitica]|uniref:Glycosyltransferase family 69 protein n=1 Tax=Pseudovirgaria hyperparasitica TaxID=470096 RepID=A0A6A6WND1_9PEZI|nr:uncharacterized protein EJ05DRAFT_482324 [Pseudovirgaria hyperparasitica]KAF2763532.1 hypothetical protein EJ05DRAFT_482324 [Pseudovirgaria hyperparasitica]